MRDRSRSAQSAIIEIASKVALTMASSSHLNDATLGQLTSPVDKKTTIWIRAQSHGPSLC